MHAPRMIVVAGPPGSGKSSLFPVAETGLDSFNADDRAAELNGGSYRNITPPVRIQVGKELERFIAGHIRGRRSFAYETTLRTDITFLPAGGRGARQRILDSAAIRGARRRGTQHQPRCGSGGWRWSFRATR